MVYGFTWPSLSDDVKCPHFHSCQNVVFVVEDDDDNHFFSLSFHRDIKKKKKGFFFSFWDANISLRTNENNRNQQFLFSHHQYNLTKNSHEKNDDYFDDRYLRRVRVLVGFRFFFCQIFEQTKII